MHDIPSLVVHLVGVFAFLLAHGTSAGLAFAMRRERDPARMRRLLELSEASFSLLYPSLLVLVAGGIAGGFRLGYWSLGWIWVALGLLVVVSVAMSILGGERYSELRKPLGLKYRAGFKIYPAPLKAHRMRYKRPSPGCIPLSSRGWGSWRWPSSSS